MLEYQRQNILHQEISKDSTETIEKFRNLVSDLTSELEAIKAPLNEMDDQQDYKQIVLSLNLQVVTVSEKLRASQLQLRQCKTNLEVAIEQVDILKVFRISNTALPSRRFLFKRI